MRQNYAEPEMKIVTLTAEDVIVTSGECIIGIMDEGEINPAT